MTSQRATPRSRTWVLLTSLAIAATASCTPNPDPSPLHTGDGSLRGQVQEILAVLDDGQRLLRANVEQCRRAVNDECYYEAIRSLRTDLKRAIAATDALQPPQSPPQLLTLRATFAQDLSSMDTAINRFLTSAKLDDVEDALYEIADAETAAVEACVALLNEAAKLVPSESPRPIQA